MRADPTCFNRIRSGTCGCCAWFLAPFQDHHWRGRVRRQVPGQCAVRGHEPRYRDDGCELHEDNALRRIAHAEIADRRTVVFYTEVLQSLQPDAEARGLHVNALVRLLIDRIVDDKLVGAVLDDVREAA
jgi:hypothetical protein